MASCRGSSSLGIEPKDVQRAYLSNSSAASRRALIILHSTRAGQSLSGCHIDRGLRQFCKLLIRLFFFVQGERQKLGAFLVA